MIPSFKNYDLIFYQLRNGLKGQLENALREELDQLSNEIKTIITSDKKVKGQPVAVLQQIFNFRIKAIKWLASKGNIDYSQGLNEKRVIASG